MNEQDDQPRPDGADAKVASRLRAVARGDDADAGPPPPVRLRREFKGLTVADLHREEIARRLPGQVRSALEHLERGDLAAAERALPGTFGAVLQGPGDERRRRRRAARWGWFAAVGAAAVAVGWLVARWLVS